MFYWREEELKVGGVDRRMESVGRPKRWKRKEGSEQEMREKVKGEDETL